MADINEAEAIALVRKHYELLNAGDIDGAFDLMTEDIETHSVMEIKGTEMLKAMTTKASQTFEGFREEIEDIFACGDKVCVRGKRSGKMSSNFGQMKATGKQIETSWIVVNRIENGKIAERWLNHDDLGFLQAVGLMGGGPGQGGHGGHGQGGHDHGHGGHGGHGHSHGDQGPAPAKPSHPVSPSEITSEWLNTSLGKGGHLKSATVKSFTTKEEPMSATELVARLNVEYEGVAGSPTDLVARFPTTNQMARQLFRAAQTHVRAVRFYEHMAPRGRGISVPKAFFTLSEPTGDFIIIHEDIEPNFTRLNSIQGSSLADAQTFINKLALFHAQWWKSTSDGTKGMEWLRSAPASELTYLQLFETSWRFMSTNCTLSPQIISLGDTLGKKLSDLYSYHRNCEPFTVCNNNLGPTSLLRGPSGEWAVDTWNEVSLGKGVRDVAYFLSNSLPSDIRKAHESDLLRIYHQTLLNEGVSGYKFQKCMSDYKIFVCLSFAQLVCNGAGLFVLEHQGKISQSQQPKLQEFKALFARLESALLDLDCATALNDFKLK